MNKEDTMDCSTPIAIEQSGRRAFNAGVSISDCPFSERTNMNGFCWWRNGWNSESKKTCSGDNCNAKRGVGHSHECVKQHDQIVGQINHTLNSINYLSE